MHIRVIVPVLDSDELVGKAEKEYRSFAGDGVTISAGAPEPPPTNYERRRP